MDSDSDSGSESSVMSVKTLASHWRAKTYSALSFDKIFSNGAHFAFDFTFKPLVKYYCFMSLLENFHFLTAVK